jgi:predicted signal transduction protein with EAL and GGDEF domain
LITQLQDESILATIKSKIEKTINQPFEVSGNKIDVGISIGIAIFPDEALDKSQLLDKADKRMYHCKNSKY